MTYKTQPIKFPIDPKKIYVTRGGSIISNIEIGSAMASAYVIPHHPMAKYCIDIRDGKSCYPHIEALDLVAEVIEGERPKTQPRDWSSVVTSLHTHAMHSVRKMHDVHSMCLDTFREEALAILQEFDAQNQVNDKDGVKVRMECQFDTHTEIRECYMPKPVRAENTPAVKESLTTEPCDCNQLLSNPADYCQECQEKITSGWVDGESDLEKMAKAGDMRVEVKFKHKAPTKESIEFVVGELYEVNGVCGDTVGKLIAFYDTEYVVLEEERGFVIYEEREFIRKHTPKPVEHEIDIWINVYKRGNTSSHSTKRGADTHVEICDLERVACFNIKRTFVMGEGL